VMSIFLPRPAHHRKPSGSDGGCGGNLDTEPPSSVRGSDSGYGPSTGMADSSCTFSSEL
jgi:hypothetical protein